MNKHSTYTTSCCSYTYYRPSPSSLAPSRRIDIPACISSYVVVRWNKGAEGTSDEGGRKKSGREKEKGLPSLHVVPLRTLILHAERQDRTRPQHPFFSPSPFFSFPLPPPISPFLEMLVKIRRPRRKGKHPFSSARGLLQGWGRPVPSLIFSFSPTYFLFPISLPNKTEMGA